MGNAGKPGGGGSADIGGRAVIALKVGKTRFNRRISPAQRVIFSVAQVRRRGCIIQFIMAGDFGCQIG
jgi:hypothetical protein